MQFDKKTYLPINELSSLGSNFNGNAEIRTITGTQHNIRYKIKMSSVEQMGQLRASK